MIAPTAPCCNGMLLPDRTQFTGALSEVDPDVKIKMAAPSGKYVSFINCFFFTINDFKCQFV